MLFRSDFSPWCEWCEHSRRCLCIWRCVWPLQISVFLVVRPEFSKFNMKAQREIKYAEKRRKKDSNIDRIIRNRIAKARERQGITWREWQIKANNRGGERKKSHLVQTHNSRVVQNNHKTSTLYSILFRWNCLAIFLRFDSVALGAMHTHTVVQHSLFCSYRLTIGSQYSILRHLNMTSIQYLHYHIVRNPLRNACVRLALTPAFNFENSDSSTDYNFLSLVFLFFAHSFCANVFSLHILDVLSSIFPLVGCSFSFSLAFAAFHLRCPIV